MHCMTFELDDPWPLVKKGGVLFDDERYGLLPYEMMQFLLSTEY
jgi:hypothetical protein